MSNVILLRSGDGLGVHIYRSTYPLNHINLEGALVAQQVVSVLDLGTEATSYNWKAKCAGMSTFGTQAT
jgi:hypothetical protein